MAWEVGQPYQGVNPAVWDMLSDDDRRRAWRAANEAYAAQFKPRPCACQGRPGCECPCHR